jgi:hypothetical protein
MEALIAVMPSIAALPYPVVPGIFVVYFVTTEVTVLHGQHKRMNRTNGGQVDTHVGAGLIVVLKNELQSAIRDCVGIPIPPKVPVT